MSEHPPRPPRQGTDDPAASAAVSLTTLGLRIAHHAWPVLVAQLLSMSMMVADTIIAGRYGTEDLAAVAIGSGLYISVLMLMSGILQAVAPIVAHHYGAGRYAALAPALQQGFWLALALALPAIALLAFPGPLLALADVPPAVSALSRDYLRATAWGLPAVLLYRAFYAFNNAVGQPRILMAISFIAALAHVPLAWAMVNGRLGLPSLGGPGCGVATTMVNWIAFACGLAYLAGNPSYRRYRLFSAWQWPQMAAFKEMLRLGLPMGFSTFVEITSFTLIALFAARLGAEAVAGHRIVGNIAALAYMLPLALAIATLVLVGHAAGAHDWGRARLTVRAGMIVAASLSTILGFLTWLARAPLVAMYSDDPAVLHVALGLVLYVCLYQFFDAVQTVASHALRGYRITFAPMLIHVLCFWGVGLGGGYWLAFQGFGRDRAPSVAGFWEGALLATVLAALLFTAYLRRAIGRLARR